MIFKITENMHGVALYGQYNVVVYLCRGKPSELAAGYVFFEYSSYVCTFTENAHMQTDICLLPGYGQQALLHVPKDSC